MCIAVVLKIRERNLKKEILTNTNTVLVSVSKKEICACAAILFL